ncbi:hypothetical protein [Isoptericola sp. NPDC056605]|uniref:hypothetical protein n=1 Tax=Isoptericola sp. NPDC056605 TaxID=3345876 RepID=UPI0036A0A8D6
MSAPTPRQVKAAVTEGNAIPGIYPNATPPYVRGTTGLTYEITAGVASIDLALRRLQAVILEHPDLGPDIDVLLDARNELTQTGHANEAS